MRHLACAETGLLKPKERAPYVAAARYPHPLADRGELVELLRSNRVLLMVGAGSSTRVGYPLWHELLEDMCAEIASTVDLTDLDPLEGAEAIRTAAARRHGSDDAYLGYLERKFAGRSPAHDGFHRSLVRLGCRGIVTANYDPVLESAVTAEFAAANPGFMCRALQVTTGRIFPVLEYLRGIADEANYSSVLHIHGYYDSPVDIVLTASDYQRAYGVQDSSHLDLDTHHRKVLWSLFVNHPIFFVGFSMEDPVLLHLLAVVRDDFSTGPYLGHFALLPRRGTDDVDVVIGQLERNGVTPLFYPVVDLPGGGGDNHSALEGFVDDLLADLGRAEPSDGLLNLSDRLVDSDGT
jgi:SIR2-like domain